MSAGSDLRPIQDTQAECAPSWFALDPDSGSLYVYGVVVERPDQPPRAVEFRYPIGARCQESRNALVTVLERVRLPDGVRVTVGACH